MSPRVIRVGGVDEPFNLPWDLAFERGAYAHLGVEVTFTTFAGGTGALVEALEAGTIDLATLLTEGAVTAIARGRDVRIHSSYTDSPLRWGVHVASNSKLTKLADLADARFGISRFGSGSELMAWVLADQRGWDLEPGRFVELGGLDAALQALPAGEADVFMWERFVTAPHVGKNKPFRRAGEVPTPWPAFVTAARAGLLASDRALVDAVVETALREAAALAADPDATIELITDRYGMNRRDTRSWLEGVEWPDRPRVDHEVLASVADVMLRLGRIDTPITTDRLV